MVKGLPQALNTATDKVMTMYYIEHIFMYEFYMHLCTRVLFVNEQRDPLPSSLYVISR